MDILEEHEFIVVGSGCTGAMAAQTLIESGAKVLMLDVGEHDEKYSGIPQKSFINIRKNNEDQYKYWLGEDFEAIAFDKTTTGAQLTPARKFMLKNTNTFLSFLSYSFSPMESLSYGGLGNAWGVGCCLFSDEELKAAGLQTDKMRDAYQVVADRIGISGDNDDANPYTGGNLKNLQKSAEIDSNSKSIYEKYAGKKEVLNQKGFYLGKPALALLTEKKEDRLPIDYNELDFYTDQKQSAYRPWITINKLKKNPNFRYLSNAFVLSYSEEGGSTLVNYFHIHDNDKKTVKCKKLILCAGTISTARIVLRSAGAMNMRLPFLCNPYKYFTLLQPSLLGKVPEDARTAFAQLAMYYDPSGTNYDVSAASVYSYRSLMLFRTIKEVPLNLRDARIIMQYLLPAVSLMGVHHPDHSYEGKYLELVHDVNMLTGDTLKIEYSLSREEEKEIHFRDRQYSRAMNKLGCYTLKKLDPGFGASIHYAGCLPFSDEEKPFHLNTDGRLHGTKNVFIADGSGFRYLPAKGITLSIMAYAHLVSRAAIRN
jgi:choline dehydrogenase-like flavoprotein